MKQATLIEIAESCKVTYVTVYHWAKKAGKKITSINHKLKNAKKDHPAVFNEDEIVCIVGAHLEIMGDFTEATLQDPRNSIGSDGKKIPTDSKENTYRSVTKPSLDQKMAVVHEVRKLAKLSERTTPGMPFDYHLNIAKKRLSGLAANNKYTPIMNLLEAPNNEEE